ncbi:MAG TPA: Ig-like domain-containing protein [Longimicrobiaceae bacterium]|nr:Ig-like domain-containing protein [Longimicrobiaceae bacterium]
MRRITQALTLAASLVAAAACTDRASSPTLALPAGARPTLSDGAHGGTAGFYFLPPMLRQPAAAGTFDPDLSPRVSLCVLRGGTCTTTLAEYTRTFGPDGERVQVKTSESHYLVNWDTKTRGTGLGDTVRISVAVESRTLGYADVVLVSNGAAARNVDSDEYIALIDGRTLPIKFRIETGIPGSLTVTPGAAEVTPGGTQQFVARINDLHGNEIRGRAIGWRASHEAAIDAAGVATGVKPGCATITATSGDLTASAQLTVASPQQPSTTDPGEMPLPTHNWTPTGTGGQGNFGVWGSSASDVYMANWVGVWHFNGSTWATIPELEWHGTLDVYGFGANDVWAVGPSGRILHYDGSAWSGRRFNGDSVYAEPLGVWENPSRNLYLWGVWGAAANDVFVAGDSGTVLHWNGAAWSRMSTGTTVGLRRVWGTSGNNVYVTGEAGTLLHYDGTAWSRVALPTGETLERVWGSSASDVYVGGANATLLHYDGSGWSRIVLPIDPTFTVHTVWGTAGDNVYAAGSGGFVLRWDRTAWRAENSGQTEQILGLWGASGTDVFAAMAHGWLARR